MSDHPVYNEQFEVVMMRDGVTEDTAKQEDFVRVNVTARDPLAAIMSDRVVEKSKDGFRAIVATKPGVPTGPETMARRRALDADGSKVWR